MAKCDITPISAFQSTNLNSKIDNFDRLSDRVLRSLGYPFVNIEIHRDTLYENISVSCEMFAKFAGYTQEYLLFDSALYEKNKGIRLDQLFSLQNADNLSQQIEHNNESEDFSNYKEEPETLYIATSAIPGSNFITSPSASPTTLFHKINYTNGIPPQVSLITPLLLIGTTENSFDANYDLTFTKGSTYTFNVSNSANASANAPGGIGNPLSFTTTLTGVIGSEFSGVTRSGTPGTEGATVTLTIPEDYEGDEIRMGYLRDFGDGPKVYTIGTGGFNPVNVVSYNPIPVNPVVTKLDSPLLSGIFENQIFSETIYKSITATNGTLSAHFTPSHKENFTRQGSKTTSKKEKYLNSFDYDVMDYRKVIAVQDFEEGSTTGINTLFTIEQTLAQQTYFSYAMGNYGFDLVSWYVLKDWLEMREKLLATKRSYTFDDRTQTMRMYPQPDAAGNDVRFYGVVSCYVERPIRDIIKEHWVYQYTLALTKIAVANIRGKYGNVTLFGGGSLNSSDLMSQGLAEKEKLETALYEGAPGLGDAEPPMFFVG